MKLLGGYYFDKLYNYTYSTEYSPGHENTSIMQV